MSQEKVETVELAVEAFNRRDGADFDALLADDAEIVPVRAAIDGVIYRGRDAGSQYCHAVEERWENLEWEIEEIRDCGHLVLALGRIRGRGRASGAVVDSAGAWVAEVCASKIARFQTFSDPAEALKAAGLEE